MAGQTIIIDIYKFIYIEYLAKYFIKYVIFY